MDEEKKKKLARVDELIEHLGVSREDVMKHWQSTNLTNMSTTGVFNKTDFANIKLGMFWYEGDIFSFDRIMDKKIKAVVELVEDGVVYGDLTASELFDIHERHLSWYDAERFFKEYSYPCRENEKIVWYNIKQFRHVYDNYNVVRKVFEKLQKQCRRLWYWSSTMEDIQLAMVLYFRDGSSNCHNKGSYFNARPVLALRVY